MRLPEPFIKICSLREPQQAEFAVAAGASAVGLIFAEARRQVTVDRAVEIVRELRRLDGDQPFLVVGVFVDQAADEINGVAERVGLDLVQLHGFEIPEVVARIERPVIKVVRTAGGQDGWAFDGYESLAVPPIAYLVDGHSTSGAGGTGARGDWTAASELALGSHLVLAGGLTPENVGDAVRAVRPFGVDVSTGVEIEGVKDRAKVIAFVGAARAAFAGLDVGENGVVPISEAAEPVHRP